MLERMEIFFFISVSLKKKNLLAMKWEDIEA